jgi:hypothetical protein
MKKKAILSILFLIFMFDGIELYSVPGQDDIKIKRFVLMVGANSGGPGREKLRFAVSDANALKKVLEEMGGVYPENSILLAEPSRSVFFEEFDKMEKAIRQAKSQYHRVEIIFYYSGHSDETYMLLGNEKVSYRELRGAIGQMEADVRIAILDSCASGSFARIKGGRKKLPFLMDSAYDMKGYALMTSSSADELSQESDRLKGSFFTYNLISGLRGAADTTQDGKITLNEVYHFAFNQTLAQTEKTLVGPQHPNYAIRMTGTGDVVMTDIKRSSAVLSIHKDLFGKIFIRDKNEALVLELNKIEGRPVEIGLGKGKYKIINIHDDKIYTAAIHLSRGEQTELTDEHFVEIEKVYRRSRGKGLDYPDIGDIYKRVPFHFSILAKPGKKEKTITNFSLHLFSSYRSIMDGLSLGSGISSVGEELNGAQVSFIGNISGRYGQFLQLAYIFNSARGSFNGVQVSRLFNYVKRDLKGVQFSGFNYVGRIAIGLQAGLLFNYVKREFTGLQAAFFFNYASSVKGVQSGMVNIAKKIRGAQIGLINIGREVKGTQIGLVNVSKEIDPGPIGLLNFVARGRNRLGLWVDELGFLNCGIKHGTKWVYNLYMLGTNHNFDLGVIGLGYGVNIPVGKSIYINVDMVAKMIRPINRKFHLNDDPAFIASARFAMGFSVFKKASLMAGISYNYMHNTDPSNISISKPFLGYTHKSTDNKEMDWLGLFIGLEIPLFSRK